MVLESHDVFQRQLCEAAAICIFIGVFDDLNGYSWIHSTGRVWQVVHLKRGYGNLPTCGEMNHWQHCICMRFA